MKTRQFACAKDYYCDDWSRGKELPSIALDADICEVLNACLFELKRHNGNWDKDMDETMDFDGEIEKVEQALSKAEGKI